MLYTYLWNIYMSDPLKCKYIIHKFRVNIGHSASCPQKIKWKIYCVLHEFNNNKKRCYSLLRMDKRGFNLKISVVWSFNM